ncbi:MAG: hypothetical protein JNL58_32345 [Planctomyces sp.]|nr:hypothetical protein [Planctomyces sp.]
MHVICIHSLREFTVDVCDDREQLDWGAWERSMGKILTMFMPQLTALIKHVTNGGRCGTLAKRGETDAGSAGTQPARDTLAEASE